MPMRIANTLLSLLLVATTAPLASCNIDGKPQPSGAAANAQAKSPAWEKKFTADCPAYPGNAKVELVDIEGGYTATILTADEDSVETIREHARYVEAASAAGVGGDALRFERKMGDRTRNCPVVLDDTVITTVDQPGGVKMTIKAKTPAQVVELRQAARKRAETLAIMREAMK
jgi:hypothetical protein